jgi:hypothetical protein
VGLPSSVGGAAQSRNYPVQMRGKVERGYRPVQPYDDGSGIQYIHSTAVNRRIIIESNNLLDL